MSRAGKNVLTLSQNITLEVAKELVEGKQLDEWSWAHIKLPAQEAAISKVAHRLHMQGITNVPDMAIELRLQNAIKDQKASMCSASSVYRANKRAEARKPLHSIPVLAATPEATEPRPYDPIRDL